MTAPRISIAAASIYFGLSFSFRSLAWLIEANTGPHHADIDTLSRERGLVAKRRRLWLSTLLRPPSPPGMGLRRIERYGGCSAQPVCINVGTHEPPSRHTFVQALMSYQR